MSVEELAPPEAEPEVLGLFACVLVLAPPEALLPMLLDELVLGALEPPAALELLLDFEVAPELASFSFFLPLVAPLCLPLFLCSRPWASVVTFGFEVGPAVLPLFVSPVVAPAAAPVLLEPLVELPVLLPVVAPAFAPAPAPAPDLFTSVPTFAPAEPWVVVLWEAAIWLNDTAKKPEIRTGNNLRIVVLLGWEKGYLRSCCKARARKGGMSHTERRERALQREGR